MASCDIDINEITLLHLGMLNGTSKGRYLFVGDVSLDLSVRTARLPEPDEKIHCEEITEQPGGVATNTAVAFARAGGRAVLLCQIGNDIASERVLAAFADESGLEIDARRRVGSLCRVVSLIDPLGEKRLLLHPGVSLYPDAEEVERTGFDDVRHVHTAIYGTAAADVIGRARDHGASWSIDLEPATLSDGLKALAGLLRDTRIVFVNDRAAMLIGDDAVSRLLDMGVQTVVRTMGARGAQAYGREATARIAVPLRDPIVDTTGAGDCLAGWLLAGLWCGESIAHALPRAVNAATCACMALGPQAGLPRLADLPTSQRQEPAE